MHNTDLIADHVGEFVVIKTPKHDIVARLEPEVAIRLSQDLLEAAEKALRSTKGDE